jgi:uncharacterized protein (DUF433 family)
MGFEEVKRHMTQEHPEHRDRIIVDPEIMVGKPVVNGTRIPVELVLKRLAHDLDPETLLRAYPRLTREDVKACLAYAHSLVEGEEVFPSSA